MFILFKSPDSDAIALPSPSRTFVAEIALIILMLVLSIQSIWRTERLLSIAKVNFLVDKVTAIAEATREFQLLYKALPGDFAYASVYIDSALLNGNGNGLIDTDDERGQAWAHLAASGLLPYLRVDGGPIASHLQKCSLKRCPHNTRRQGIVLTHGHSGLNFLESGNELLLGDNLPIGTLAGLDAYLDDGAAKTGLIQINKNMSSEKIARCQYTALRTPPRGKPECAGVVKLI